MISAWWFNKIVDDYILPFIGIYSSFSDIHSMTLLKPAPDGKNVWLPVSVREVNLQIPTGFLACHLSPHHFRFVDGFCLHTYKPGAFLSYCCGWVCSDLSEEPLKALTYIIMLVLLTWLLTSENRLFLLAVQYYRMKDQSSGSVNKYLSTKLGEDWFFSPPILGSTLTDASFWVVIPLSRVLTSF